MFLSLSHRLGRSCAHCCAVAFPGRADRSVIVLGAFLLSRPRWFGYGVGVLVFFAVASIPGNSTVYDPEGFLNAYMGMIVGMLVSSAYGAVIFPPNARWLLRKLEDDLRSLVLFTVRAPGQGLANAFEGRVRDVVQQAYGYASNDRHMQSSLIFWMFTSLEVGHAVIQLRAAIERQLMRPRQPLWGDSCFAVLIALEQLFQNPSNSNVERAEAALVSAIGELYGEEVVSTVSASIEARRISAYMNFIRVPLARLGGAALNTVQAG